MSGRSFCIVGASGALAAAAVVACLSDLAAFPPPPAEPIEAGPPAESCGDGLIETLDNGEDAGESCDPGDAGDAAVPGCTKCQVTCEGALDDAGHCYFLVGETTTYREAIAACNAAGSHVVTIASVPESDFANGVAGDAGYWIGLEKTGELGGYGPPAEVNEPGWPQNGRTCPGCFAVGADDAGMFPYLEDAGDPDPDCLLAERGTWNSASCESTRPHKTLCEREPIGDRVFACGGLLCTTLDATAGSKRYVIWQSKTTADKAQKLCADTYENGSLVMLDSPREREQLVREIAHRIPSPFTVWIGLHYDPDAGAWSWDDARSRPLPWANHQPRRSAGRAFLRVSRDFDTQLAAAEDDGGVDANVFVCQRPPR